MSSMCETELWVDKYKPVASKNIIGQQGDRSNMNKLKMWLRDWNSNHLSATAKKTSKPPPWGASNDNGAWAKCALLSGPPGVGKTTTAYLVSKELGYDVVEMNASDTRSKKMLSGSVADTLNTTSVANMVGKGNENEHVTSKRVLLMDEVDGMAGNEDRGGVAELIQLLKTSKVPVIAMCNDRQHQKIRSLANHCYDLRFARPRVEQIKAAMMSVCFKEKIPIKPDALSELITGCGQDVRQVLHHLSMVKASSIPGDTKMDAMQAKKEADTSKKTSVKIGPWDVCKSVFNNEEHKTMSFFDKSDLYFHDYNLAGLFVQENYLASKPTAAGGNKKKLMELVSRAADSIAEGDLVEKGIRSGMNWSLLPTAAVFCSVLPGEYMKGFLTGQILFPSWLGKNSKRTKIDRILSELQSHTRLSAGVSKGAINLDYGQRLRDHIVSPLVKEAAEGVEASVARMNEYNLLREDLDGLLEVTQWPDKPDALQNVDSKTKAAFTRRYNKEGATLPFAVQTIVTKKAKVASSQEGDAWGDEEEEMEDDQDDGSDVEKDAMIKMKKPVVSKKAPGKGEAGPSKAKGPAKPKGAAKGKKK
jgi:replication factor C subunit 1